MLVRTKALAFVALPNNADQDKFIEDQIETICRRITSTLEIRYRDQKPVVDADGNEYSDYVFDAPNILETFRTKNIEYNTKNVLYKEVKPFNDMIKDYMHDHDCGYLEGGDPSLVILQEEKGIKVEDFIFAKRDFVINTVLARFNNETRLIIYPETIDILSL